MIFFNLCALSQEWPRQTKPKKGQFMNFSQGHSGTKVQCESCLFFSGKKTPEFTKKGEIHELFVLALSLVWFAGATPDLGKAEKGEKGRKGRKRPEKTDFQEGRPDTPFVMLCPICGSPT